MQYYCQACLKTGESVSVMTSTEDTMYRNIICKVPGSLNSLMYICVHCRWILRKLIKFIKQCERAENILNEIDLQDSKLLHPSPITNLTSSSPVVFYLGPNELPISDFKSEEACGSDDDIPLVMIDGNPENSRGLENTEPATPQVLFIGDDHITDDVKSEVGDVLNSGDEDDIPLVMLGRSADGMESEDKATKKSRKKESGNTKKTKKKELKAHKKRKEKKQLKEGFTSRMVQETDEYIVIKLTKEQVLQEMADNSTTPKYQMYPYKCEKCVKGFNFEDVLNTHMDKHSPKNGELQCDICTQYCANSVSLRGHIKSHTTRYKCKVCGLIRLSRQHILEHHGIAHTAAAAAYSCDQCRFTTYKRTVIQHHVRTHTKREPHACHHCGKLYKNLETLRIHITRHDTRQRARCAQCAVTFAYASQLRRHARAVHERRDYYCVECDVVFKSMDTMRLHFQKAKRHRDETSYKYKCTQCPQRFVSPSTLATHETTAHGAEKRSVCTLCVNTRAYSSRAALRVHVRRAHATRESIPCPICERVFARKSCLTVHMRTHTGELPYECECGAAFAQSSTLKAHRIAKHKNSFAEGVTEQ